MIIKVLEPLTDAVLTREDIANMKLPFTRGWEAWGIFDHRGVCVDSFPRYSQAVAALNSYLPLAA